MGNVITVTREFGSMGRKIARMTAEKMGYNYYDRDIIERTAAELRENIDVLASFEGKKISVFDKMMYPLGLGTASMKKKIYEMEKSVIIELASSENCVIVGRCSDYILHEAGHKNMLNVFIYAPYDQRLDSCCHELNLSRESAKAYLKDVDEARHYFYKHHTGKNFHSTDYRQLLIDSSILPHNQCADWICQMAHSKLNLT